MVGRGWSPGVGRGRLVLTHAARVSADLQLKHRIPFEGPALFDSTQGAAKLSASAYSVASAGQENTESGHLRKLVGPGDQHPGWA
jgi:hypothetical protein